MDTVYNKLYVEMNNNQTTDQKYIHIQYIVCLTKMYHDSLPLKITSCYTFITISLWYILYTSHKRITSFLLILIAIILYTSCFCINTCIIFKFHLRNNRSFVLLRISNTFRIRSIFKFKKMLCTYVKRNKTKLKYKNFKTSLLFLLHIYLCIVWPKSSKKSSS